MEGTRKFFIATKSKNYAYFYFYPDTLKYSAIQLNETTKEIKKQTDESAYTVVYKHDTYKVYGLIKDANCKPNLYWITAKDLEDRTSKNTSKAIPFEEGQLIDLTSNDYNIFQTLNKNKIRRQYLDSRRNIGYAQFLEKIGIALPETAKTEETEKTEEIEEEIEHSENKQTAKEDVVTENLIIKKQNNIDIDSFLEKYYIQRKEREAFEKQKEENSQLALKLKKLCAIATNNSLTDETFLDVKEVVKIDSAKSEKDLDTSELVYELILKALKENDSISIPLSYFKKLKTTIRKNLFLNMSCTKYTALGSIKISNTSNDSLFAVINYDEDLDYVRITVLKSYNSNKINDDDIALYELNYNKWKKENSWIS